MISSRTLAEIATRTRAREKNIVLNGMAHREKKRNSLKSNEGSRETVFFDDKAKWSKVSRRICNVGGDGGRNGGWGARATLF